MNSIINIEKQNVNRIINSIEPMLDLYFLNNIIEFKKFIIFNNRIYRIIFKIGSPLPQQKLKDIKHTSNKIVEYIRKKIRGCKTSCLTIKYRYKKGIYEVFISIKRIHKKDIYIFKDNEYNCENENYILIRVLNIIRIAGRGGLSKSELYLKTRFLKPHQRENIIINLLAQNKIKEEFVGVAKKRQKIYYAV